jgi:transposase
MDISGEELDTMKGKKCGLTLTEVEIESINERINELKGRAYSYLRRRLQAILMLGAQGMRRVDVGKKTKMDIRTLGRWLKRYQELGLDGVDDREHPGRPPKLGDEELLELKGIITSGPEQAGFSTGIWTSNMIVDMIFKRYGIRYSSAHMTRILHRIGLTYQLPKKNSRKRTWRSRSDG